MTHHPTAGASGARTDADDAVTDDAIPDPATGAALIAEQRARVEAATDVDGRVLFGAWGTAWLLGYGAMWAAWPDRPRVDVPFGAAMAVLSGGLVVAGVITAVHLARRSAGVRGTSATQGAMYGWSWFLAFAVVAALGGWLASRDVPGDVMAVTMTVVSTLLVGALYMAGGAMLEERSQFVLGAWICLSNVAGLLAGVPTLLLVMALAGGGGMLVAALLDHVRRARPRSGTP